MTIDIAPEDHAELEQMVRSGRYSSLTEAVHDGVMHLKHEDPPDEEWLQELDAKIQRGLADEAAGRFRPASEYLAELRARQGR